MLTKKMRSMVVSLVMALALVAVPITAFAADIAGGDLYYNGGQTNKIVYSEIGRKEGVERNYMVKATVKVGGNTYTSGYKSKLMLQGSNIILADEPTSGLDEENEKIVMKLLQDLNRAGATIIMVTHNMKLCDYFSRIIDVENLR